MTYSSDDIIRNSPQWNGVSMGKTRALNLKNLLHTKMKC